MNKWRHRYKKLPPDVRIVKMWILQEARASFRKRGPGIMASLRSCLGRMGQHQRKIALEKGWDRGILRFSSGGKLVVS